MSFGGWAAPAANRERAPPNTLAHYDHDLPGAIDAFGPVVSAFMPRSGAQTAAPGDVMKILKVPHASLVRVLVKAPAPARPWKILRVAPITAGETANTYFASAIDTAIAGGYAKVVFPRAAYDFVTPAATQSHLTITGAKDLVIDGQGSTLSFASPLAAGVTISNSSRLVFRGFDLDWPHTLMASIGTVVSIDKTTNPATMD